MTVPGRVATTLCDASEARPAGMDALTDSVLSADPSA